LENTINSNTGEPYLKKIEAVLHGEKNAEALELSGYLLQAYNIAEDFCALLSSRVKGGGFMSTLLLKRIGSTMFAGENTAKKMLAWTAEGKEKLRNLYDIISDEDDDENEDAVQSDIKDLTAEEVDCLEKLVNVLKSNTDTDPKYNRVKAVLTRGVEGEGAWRDKGCILFSQYYDSAIYVAERLSMDFTDVPIGLYAGGDKSGIYKSGLFKKESKDEIKRLVKERELKILVGTDSASEGLNLQALGTLINIDLPWNPTRLEQRKGRIQRIGQLADAIYIYNMRYKDSVEDKVHHKLSERLQAIHSLFGQIPDVLEDVWVAMAQRDEERAENAINNLPQKNPFVLKYEETIPDCGDWEKCAVVLDKQDELRELRKGW
jgi:superfamily II DNA/RNA helicase